MTGIRQSRYAEVREDNPAGLQGDRDHHPDLPSLAEGVRRAEDGAHPVAYREREIVQEPTPPGQTLPSSPLGAAGSSTGLTATLSLAES